MLALRRWEKREENPRINGENNNLDSHKVIFNSCEWEEIRQILSRAVAVPYCVVTVTIRCDWMRRTKTMGSHFNVMACRSY
jgi:hypothetical protein